MLFIFVEGPDDYNYFDSFFGHFFDKKIIKYADMKKSKVNSFIKSITSMPNSDYLFFGDEDGKGIDIRKKELLEIYRDISPNKIVIVQYEIESWYYAGLSKEDCKKLKLQHYQENTNTLTKEQFYRKLSRPSDKKHIMSQILLLYSKELAKNRNDSYRLFYSMIQEPTAV